MANGVKTGGRSVGTPNKATQEARQAIALFVDQNAHRLTEWLDAVEAVKVAHPYPVDPSTVEPEIEVAE
jgi:hypothetical protein